MRKHIFSSVLFLFLCLFIACATSTQTKADSTSSAELEVHDWTGGFYKKSLSSVEDHPTCALGESAEIDMILRYSSIIDLEVHFDWFSDNECQTPVNPAGLTVEVSSSGLQSETRYNVTKESNVPEGTYFLRASISERNGSIVYSNVVPFTVESFDHTGSLDLTQDSNSIYYKKGNTVSLDDIVISEYMNPSCQNIDAASEKWSWDYSTRTLTLAGVNFSSPDFCVKLPQDSTVIVVDGTTNVIANDSTEGNSYDKYGIIAEGDIRFEGEGTLIFQMTGLDIYNVDSSAGIRMEDGCELTFAGPSIASISVSSYTRPLVDTSDSTIILEKGKLKVDSDYFFASFTRDYNTFRLTGGTLECEKESTKLFNNDGRVYVIAGAELDNISGTYYSDHDEMISRLWMGNREDNLILGPSSAICYLPMIGIDTSDASIFCSPTIAVGSGKDLSVTFYANLLHYTDNSGGLSLISPTDLEVVWYNNDRDTGIIEPLTEAPQGLSFSAPVILPSGNLKYSLCVSENAEENSYYFKLKDGAVESLLTEIFVAKLARNSVLDLTGDTVTVMYSQFSDDPREGSEVFSTASFIDATTEGWLWDPVNKVLTLNGYQSFVTFDGMYVNPLSGSEAPTFSAITLPAGSKIVLAENAYNRIDVYSVYGLTGIGISSPGALSIEGNGYLWISASNNSNMIGIRAANLTVKDQAYVEIDFEEMYECFGFEGTDADSKVLIDSEGVLDIDFECIVASSCAIRNADVEIKNSSLSIRVENVENSYVISAPTGSLSISDSGHIDAEFLSVLSGSAFDVASVNIATGGIMVLLPADDFAVFKQGTNIKIAGDLDLYNIEGLEEAKLNSASGQTLTEDIYLTDSNEAAFFAVYEHYVAPAEIYVPDLGEPYNVLLDDLGNTTLECMIKGSIASINNLYFDIASLPKDQDSISLDFTDRPSVSRVSLSSEALSKIASVLDDEKLAYGSVAIKLQEGTVLLDSKAFNTILNSVKDGSVSLELRSTNVSSLNDLQKEALSKYSDFILLSAETRKLDGLVTDFNDGKVTLTVKLSKKTGQEDRFFHALCLKDNGDVEEFESTIKDDELSFDTGHFSVFAVVYDDSYAFRSSDITISDRTDCVEDDDKNTVLTAPSLDMNKTLYVGGSFEINLTNLDKKAIVSFSSSDPKVATVSSKGLIKAKKTGKTTIGIMVIQNGSVYRALLNVTVKAKGTNYVGLTEKAIKSGEGKLPMLNIYKAIEKGKTSTVTLSGLDKSAKVTYKSEDKSIATVSSKGKIKGVSKGFTAILVTVEQNGFSYEYRIVVRVTDGTRDKDVELMLK